MTARGRARFRAFHSSIAWVLLAGCIGLSCGPTRTDYGDLVSTREAAEDRARAAAALPPRPGANVLLVTIDTCRSDRLGAYGNHRILTPNMDALAARGVSFRDAVCQAPITLPSHCSIMTGLYPTAHGVRDNGRFHLDESLTTLAEALDAAGYATAAFVGAFPVAAKFGLSQGFDVYGDDLPGREGRGQGVMRERRAAEVADEARAWLSARRDAPFFAWVHFFDPHWPYEPPGAFGARYRRMPYDGEVAYVDAQIGRLLDTIDEAGLAENTIVVVTSDHGEGLGEHKEYSHSVLIYEGAVRVPLIIAPAARGPGAGGLIIDGQVRTIDIMPTVLDLVGAQTPPAVEGYTLRDGSGAPLGPEVSLAYVETYAPWYGFLWSPMRSVRTSRWKYIEAPRKELFDLDADPREATNLLLEDPAKARPWEAALEEIAVESGLSIEADVDPATMEELRALGYVGVGRRMESPRPKSGADPDLPNPNDLIGIYFEYFSPALQRFIGDDLSAAIALAQEGLARDSTNIQGLVTLAHAQNRMGLLADARASYERVLALDPENVGAHFSLAAVAFRMGDHATAEREYRAVLALDPTLVEARNDLAVVLIRTGRMEDAEAMLREATAADSTFAPAHAALAGLLYNQGRKAEAADAYVRALIADPTDRGVESAVLSLVADDAIGAPLLARLESAWAAGARSVGLAAAIAEIRFARGDRAGARRFLEERLVEGPTATLYRLRAWMHRTEGRDREALADLLAGVAAEPENAEAYASLAAFQRSNGRIEEAKRSYEACLALDPHHDAALVGLGIIHAEWKQIGRAMELWERAVRANPDSPARQNLETAKKLLAGENVKG